MSAPAESFGPYFEVRDGKIYYLGPVQTPELEPRKDGLTNDERWDAADRALDEMNLDDYDFDAWHQHRDFERKQNPHGQSL